MCGCGQVAITNCDRCDTFVCEVHAHELPATPDGVSPDAAGHFAVAIRSAPDGTCAFCRAEIGQYALYDTVSRPRAPLPAHWLDRAIVLSSDMSRSDLEKAEDADLPSSLTAAAVAKEFLRRMEQTPRQNVPITEATILRKSEYVEGWTVDCRRTEYSAPGGGRYRLPCLISVHGQLLGPALEADQQASGTWRIVEAADLDLQRLVMGVANILMLSAFVTETPGYFR